MKTLFRIFSLLLVFTAFATTASADYYLRYNNHGNNVSDPNASDFAWSDAATPVNNVCTFTYSLGADNNYIYLCSAQNVANIVNLPSAFTVNDPGSLLNWSQRQDRGGKYYLLVHGKAASSVVIEWNVSTSVITFTSGTTTYTVTAAGTNCTIDPASATVVSGNDAQFVVTPSTGYSVASGEITSGTAEVVQVGNTFVVTPSSNATLTVTCAIQSYTINASVSGEGGSVDPAKRKNIEYGGSTTFTVTALQGYYIDKAATLFEGQAEISYSQTVDHVTTITLSNVRSNGDLSVAFKTNQKPVVYISGYPAMGDATKSEAPNGVNLKGYISALYCKDITNRGFYVSSSPSITTSEVETAVTGGTSPQLVSCTNDCSGVVGSTFKALDVDLRTHGSMFESAQDLYVVAYVKTTGGGLNISEVIGFNYKICLGIQSVSIEPATVNVAPGFSTQITAIARGAGVSPNYAWYDNDVQIAGATGSTLTYTMPSDATANRTIKVVVSEGTCLTEANTTIQVGLCTAPEFASLTASDTSVTPWESVTVTHSFAPEKGAAKVEWSVTPEAELTIADGIATFRGAVLSGDKTEYTVTCSAYGNCTNSEVKVTESVKITVSKDKEDCSSH